MASDAFIRQNSADEDKKLAARRDGDLYILQHEQPNEQVRYGVIGTTSAYVGWAPPGALVTEDVWRIARLTYDSLGNVTKVFADDSAAYDKQWDLRATYTYGV